MSKNRPNYQRSTSEQVTEVTEQPVEQLEQNEPETVVEPEPEPEPEHQEPVKVDPLTLTFRTKSERIRYLHSLGFTTSFIAKAMNIRYQHVRNVLIVPLKNTVVQVQPIEPIVPAGEPMNLTEYATGVVESKGDE